MHNGHSTDEIEVICQWVNRGTVCNDTVKAKDLKAHLHLRHLIASASQTRMYSCLWHKCRTKPMKKSSLVRHVKEQHIPMKWPCLMCEKAFTRKATLMEHLERCGGNE